jgi:hypothetical protein
MKDKRQDRLDSLPQWVQDRRMICATTAACAHVYARGDVDLLGMFELLAKTALGQVDSLTELSIEMHRMGLPCVVIAVDERAVAPESSSDEG